jgi:hypothetical protein
MWWMAISVILRGLEVTLFHHMEIHNMNKKQIMKVSPLVGAVLLALSAPVAMAAAITAPAAGSLPGSFSSNEAATTYAPNGTSTTKATIAVGSPTTAVADAGDVLQFGGTAPSSYTAVKAPSTITANPGFSVGDNATLTITDANQTATTSGNPTPILINDMSGTPSQVYGTVSAGSSPLYIANANGVVVGATGVINDTVAVNLTSEAQVSTNFTGSFKFGANAVGTGTITAATGAKIGPATIIYSNGTVNLGESAIVSGNGTNAVNISGGSTAIPVSPTLNNVGDVNVSGVATVNASSGPGINGTFTNNGVTTTTGLTAGAIVNNGQLNDSLGTITAAGIGSTAGSATITNNGVITESNPSGLTLAANNTVMPSLSGNVVNNGVINVTGAAAGLTATGANINLGGIVEAGGKAVSASNMLPGNISLITGKAGATGVIDINSNLYATGTATLDGQAVRVMSGGVTTTGNDNVVVGADGVTDPFYKNAKLGYAFSLFPGTTVGASGGGTVFVKGPTTGTANINLDGVLGNAGTATVAVGNTTNPVNNINAGSAGGFSLQGGGVNRHNLVGGILYLTFTGNVNNPNGAAAAGSTAFQYNNVPVAVAAKAGEDHVNLILNPVSTTAAQNVNLLVNGNVDLIQRKPPSPLTVGSSTAVNTAAVNNHLVLQSTGNITTPYAGYYNLSGYYWPGLLYMSTIAKASDPMVLSSGTSANSITLDGNLNNATAGNVTGGGGIFLETNSLNLGGNNVLTNTNSWVNFATPAMASSFYTAAGSSFYGSVINSSTPGVVNTQALPQSSFQG